MRCRVSLILVMALGVSVYASSSMSPSSTALAQVRTASHSVAAAATQRTFYVQGPFYNAAGGVSTLAGLATLSIASSGSYTGTLATAGSKPAMLNVAGTIKGSTMTLMTKIGGQNVSITARSVHEKVTDRGAQMSLPAMTDGMEYQGTIMVGSLASGFVTVVDTAIMRQYSFAAAVTSGPDKGSPVNASLYFFANQSGTLHGYMVEDVSGNSYPILSGALNQGRMLLQIDLLGTGQIVGEASQSTSVISRLVVYKGAFSGPVSTDGGTWLSSEISQ